VSKDEKAWSYLCGSKVGSITRGTEIITYGYDGSLVTSETLNGTLTQVLNYAYNSDFNVRQLTYAGGSVNYTYDNDGLMTGTGAFTITRNAGNGLPEAVTGGALNVSRVFNGYGELESQNFVINTLNLTSWGLTRDKTGRITSKAETVEGATSNYFYTYDSMGRLLTVTRDTALIEEYQYDSVGRRTYEMNVLKGVSGRTFNYSDEDHLVTAGDTTYQYDLDGFLTTKTQGSNVTQYSHSSRGEFLRADLADGRVIEYINDPLGRRTAKKVGGVVTEKYLWQGLTRLLAVYDGSNTLIMRFQYADARMPVAMTTGGATYYLTYDQIGSLRIVADASGNVVKRIDYDSFGNIVGDTNPAFSVPFGFAGGLSDPDTGLARFGSRDYDPDTGRWTAKDPIGFGGGSTDLYGYCLDDPVNRKDPVGLVDLFVQVEGDLVAIFGGEGGFGLVIDTDNLGESGVFGTAGVAAGVNVGIALSGGFAVREIEGWSFNVDANLGAVSPVVSFDEAGFNGVAMGIGPGKGLSVSFTKTWSYTVNDAIRDIKNLLKKTRDKFQKSKPCR
jgi:RHS repeat-associated protein